MTVKTFRSTDYGAPANTNAAGALIAILDACLVNGYGSQTVTITSSEGVATVTTPTAHTLQNGTFMRISGANESAYNGDFAITVTGANMFTYAVTGSPATPATGTITSKVSPADWTKPFSSSNIAAYKTGTGSNGFYLRVDDIAATASLFPKVRGYEAMTDINTGTGEFPTIAQTATGMGFHKSTTPTARPWIIIASEKCFYACMNTTSETDRDIHFFGDFISKKSGDTFNTLFMFGSQLTYNDAFLAAISSALATQQQGHYLPRIHTQIGAAYQCSKMSPNSAQSYLGVSGGIPAYPSAIDNALHITPVYVTEAAGIRGKLPGIWNVLHNKPFQHGDIITGTGDYASKKFIALTPYSNSHQCLIEISNTW